MTVLATASVIPAVKLELLARMRDLSEFAGVQVGYANPGPGRLEATSVWFGEATSTHEISAIRAGRKTRDEDFELTMVVLVWLPAGKPEEAEAKAFELAAAVEDVLADAPQLGRDDLAWARVAGVRGVDAGPRDQGADCVLVLAIAGRARLV